MNINKEQWEVLNDITVQLHTLSDDIGSAKLEIFADKIRLIIGYDYLKVISRPNFGYS